MAYFYQLTINNETTDRSNLLDIQSWIRGGGVGGYIPLWPSGIFDVSWQQFVVSYELSVNGQSPVRYATPDDLQSAMRTALESAMANENGGLTLSWSKSVEPAPES